MIKQILHSQGLSSKEIAIYICLLDLGAQPASLIATKIGLPRSGCYILLSKICSKGLITQIIKNRVTYYAVSNPAIFLEKIKKQRAQEILEIDTLKHNLKSRLLKSPFPANSRAHYYSGQPAIAGLIAEIFDHPPTRPRIILSHNPLTQSQTFDLIPKTLSTLYVLSSQPLSGLPQNYFLRKPPRIFDLGIDIIINNYQLALICLPENFAILIESPLIASSQSKVFDFVWKFSRRF